MSIQSGNFQLVSVHGFWLLEPLCDRHHWELTFCEVSLTQGLLVGVAFVIQLFEHMGMFSELSLAVCWQERLSRG